MQQGMCLHVAERMHPQLLMSYAFAWFHWTTPIDPLDDPH